MEPFKPLDLEKSVKAHWDTINVFRTTQEKNKEGKKFFFLDGPPYVNGQPHMGHARTRAIRDPLLKYRVMKGYNVWLQPGYDCHGLPIEVKVEEELGFKGKDDIRAFGTEKFIDKCKERATGFVDDFTSFYKELGMHWDFEHPYRTLDNSYISSSWAFFKKAHDKGLLYKGKATTAWCPRCQTALAGYEATDEYRDVRDPSIYVKFPVRGKENEFIVIWTTTPWTLPANLAVTVNPKYDYAFVAVGNETWIMAKELVETVMKDCEVEEFKITGAKKGKDLEGLAYDFVLAESVPANKELEKDNDKIHTVLLGDFVTLEDGTGCVHTAPGHGQEDYSVGMKYGLPAFSPVGEDGKYDENGGSLKGIFVRKANQIVIDALHSKRLLAGEKEITHRYAHCWRCKTPIIYRASPQWFISIEKIKPLLLKENKKVNWIPGWAGEKRFQNWIEEARDWCISRQRFWGVPLPIWECECGNYEVLGSFEEVKEKALKLPDGEPDLHVPYMDKVKVRCSKCGKEISRVSDITDIWFESGAATWAGMDYPKNKAPFEEMFPIDFITEGLDQTRGWFYTIMCEGVVMFDKSPYLNVLMNDWVLDKNGEKMSKSLGNVVAPQEVIEQYGADICRFYLTSETQVWDKLKFNLDNVKITYRLFNTLWNCYQFAKTYSEGFDASKHKISDYDNHLRTEDLWILSRLSTVTKKVSDALENFLPFEASQEIDNFILNDFSRWYIKIIRDRTWVSAEGDDAEAAYMVLHKILLDLSRIIAPLAPHTGEFIYRELTGEDTVFLGGWPEAGKSDPELEEGMEIVKRAVEALNAVRNETGIKLRWPVDEVIVESEKDLNAFKGIICQMANSKDASFATSKGKYAKKEFDGGFVYLKTERSEKTVEEGYIRDLMRQIQNMRKKGGLNVSQKVGLIIGSSADFIEIMKRWENDICEATSSSSIETHEGDLDSEKANAKVGDWKVSLDFK